MDTKEKKEVKKIAPIVITAIIVGAIGFFGGMKYGQSTVQQSAGGLGNFQQSQQRQRGGSFGQNGGAVSGSIISKTDNGITVQTRDGGSKIILISGSTEVLKSVQGSSDDLTAGEQVTAIGSANSDGSITAQSVQIRPAMPQTQQQAQPQPQQ